MANELQGHQIAFVIANEADHQPQARRSARLLRGARRGVAEDLLRESSRALPISAVSPGGAGDGKKIICEDKQG
jgi:hypothetical protein